MNGGIQVQIIRLDLRVFEPEAATKDLNASSLRQTRDYSVQHNIVSHY